MVVAGIVAGGTGSRMGADRPKQMLDLCGRPVLIRTAEAFARHKEVGHIIIGIHLDWYDEVKSLAEKYLGSIVTVTKGGSDRNETVLNIIQRAKQFDDVGHSLECFDDISVTFAILMVIVRMYKEF